MENIIRGYHDNGKLYYERHYDSHRKSHGVSKVWDKDGKFLGLSKWNHGKIDSKKSFHVLAIWNTKEIL